jgi:hypothetical protein
MSEVGVTHCAHRRARSAGLLALVLALALVAALAPTTSGHYYYKRTKDCGTVTFTPYTDHAAASIRARRVGCRRARAVARRLHLRGKKRPFGYRCRARQHERGLSHDDVRCIKGKRLITWAAS